MEPRWRLWTAPPQPAAYSNTAPLKSGPFQPLQIEGRGSLCDDDVQVPRAVRPSDEDALDVRRPACPCNDVDIARLPLAGRGEGIGVVLKVSENRAGAHEHDVVQRQEVKQDRGVLAGVEDERTGLRNGPARHP